MRNLLPPPNYSTARALYVNITGSFEEVIATPHSLATPKTVILIVTVVKTSDNTLFTKQLRTL